MGMKRLVLHVERLMLNGFRPDDRDAFAESLRGEYTASARARRHEPADTGGNVARLEMPALRVPPAAKAARVGEQVARAIARGMKS